MKQPLSPTTGCYDDGDDDDDYYYYHSHTTELKFLTAGKIVVSGNNKLPKNTKMFLFPVLYISNTFLSILADPSNADFWIKVIDVSTPMPFKLSFNGNGTVPKAPNTIGTTLVFTSHILLNSLARFWYFSTFSPSFSFDPLVVYVQCILHDVSRSAKSDGIIIIKSMAD